MIWPVVALQTEKKGANIRITLCSIFSWKTSAERLKKKKKKKRHSSWHLVVFFDLCMQTQSVPTMQTITIITEQIWTVQKSQLTHFCCLFQMPCVSAAKMNSRFYAAPPQEELFQRFACLLSRNTLHSRSASCLPLHTLSALCFIQLQDARLKAHDGCC